MAWTTDDTKTFTITVTPQQGFASIQNIQQSPANPVPYGSDVTITYEVHNVGQGDDLFWGHILDTTHGGEVAGSYWDNESISKGAYVIKQVIITNVTEDTNFTIEAGHEE